MKLESFCKITKAYQTSFNLLISRSWNESDKFYNPQSSFEWSMLWISTPYHLRYTADIGQNM